LHGVTHASRFQEGACTVEAAGLVCVWELFNFRNDNIKKIFEKQEAVIEKEVGGFVGADSCGDLSAID
jgi:hypothetical protein